MAKPKLALIPAAQGDKFYSVLPSDGVGDFDFTRASTGTRIAPTGLIEEVASGDSRLNYDLLNGKVVNCPHYLLEPARTNVMLQSNQFDTTWVVANSTVTSNSGVSPSGNNDSWKLQSTAVNSETRVRQSKTFTIGQSITVSCFMKAGNVNYGIVRCWAINAGGRAWFNLSNGIVETVDGGVTAKIEKYPNGWYRCTISGTVTVASAAVDIAPSRANNEYLSGAVGENILIYGAQLEVGSYPTSYIPTNGTTITRAAESANGSGDAATFNDSEGVLMLESSALSNDGTNRRISLSDGTTNNRVLIGYTSSDNQIIGFVSSGASSQFVSILSIPKSTDFNKIVVKYKVNDFALWVNGFELATDTSGNAPIGLNTLQFKDGNSTLDFYGKTREVQYFDSALTDAQLETLTSWTSLQEMITSQLYTNY